MDISKEDLQELEEKLVLIYKFINQEKIYEKFFLDDELPRPFKYQSNLINQLLELEDAEEFLKTCIIELEELKGKKSAEISFQDVLAENDKDYLFLKYGLKDIYDVDKLDLDLLLEYF
jgi:hypothetical protein